MPFPIDYQARVEYRTLPGLPGTYPALGVDLRSGGRILRMPAILDSGSMYTVFERKYAEALGIEDITQGDPVTAVTFRGPINLYQFQLEMRVDLGGLSDFFPAPICFPEGTINRNILGRVTVFSRLSIGFREHFQHLYLATEQ